MDNSKQDNNSTSNGKQEQYPYENLVFEGGGAKGLAYSGAIDVLEQTGIIAQSKRVAGTSAGSMTALVLALGYNNQEAAQLMHNVFVKSAGQVAAILIKDIGDLGKDYGINTGKFVMDWAGELIGAKLKNKDGSPNPDATFRDLYNASLRNDSLKELYMVVANISTGYYEVRSYHHSPDDPLRKAMRESMAIPLAFTSIREQRAGQDKVNVYSDGGVLNNYPLTIFDEGDIPNPKTLGFRVDSTNEIAVLRDGKAPEAENIKSLGGYVGGLVSSALNVSNNVVRHSPAHKNRTVFIDNMGVGTLDVITPEKEKILLEEGARATRVFLKHLRPKQESDSSRLQRYDREKVYHKATEIYLFPVDEDHSRVEYIFQGVELDEIHQFYDRLKGQDDTTHIILFSGSVNDKCKVINVTLSCKVLQEIEELDKSTTAPKAKRQDKFAEPLVQMDEWQRPVVQVVLQPTRTVSESGALCTAAHYGKVEKVADLLKGGANPDHKDKQGRTALHYACELGNIKIVELLLNNQPPAGINIQDSVLETPLHIASAEGHGKVVAELLKRRANTDIQNSFGATPLHRATYRGHEQVVQQLKDSGASQTIKDHEGKLASDYAKTDGKLNEANGNALAARPRANTLPHSYKELVKKCKGLLGSTEATEICQKLVAIAGITTKQEGVMMRPEEQDKVAFGLRFANAQELAHFLQHCQVYTGLVVGNDQYVTDGQTKVIMSTDVLHKQLETILGLGQQQAPQKQEGNCMMM